MSNFKKNIWMYGIIGACIVFATLMTSLGIMASHHHFDLVVSDYYKAEIGYQKQINKINNYRGLVHKPEFAFDSIQKKLLIRFPEYDKNNPVTGRVCLYRPDNKQYDDTLALAPDAAGIADISLEKYRPGKWKMQVEWKKDTTGYYYENTFRLK